MVGGAIPDPDEAVGNFVGAAELPPPLSGWRVIGAVRRLSGPAGMLAGMVIFVTRVSGGAVGVDDITVERVCWRHDVRDAEVAGAARMGGDRLRPSLAADA